ncbi:MAG: energy transducer TonB [Burkholderiales bacterium]|nr:energy transducer TonB [Burkholderiales bacterium]
MRIGNTSFRTPQRLLAGFVLGSLLVHVVVFVWMPAWQRRMAEPPVPVLDVVLATVAPQAVVAEPAPVKPVAPQRRIEPVSEPKQAKSKPAEALPQPVLPAPAAIETAPAVAAAAPEAPRVAAESRTPAPIAEAPATPPLFNAAYLRNPAPVYPAVARRSGDQGTVMLKVLVSPEGAPLRVELDQSSGSKPLDTAALDAVKGWRFVPARRGAQNIEGWVRVPVVFKLES